MVEGEELLKQVEKHQEIKDAISLPLTEGEYIHVSTTPARLAEVFERYAEQMGYDGAGARKFFEDKVEFGFGSVDDIPPLYGNRLDHTAEKIISAIQGARLLGTVVPTKDGKYIFCLDIQAIAKHLPKLKTKGFKVQDYSSLITEQKIASFQQAVKSLSEHEFFHILQYMTEPQRLEKSARRILWSQRLFLTWATTAGVIAKLLVPRLGVPVTSLTTLTVTGAVAYLQRGQVKIEKDAYNAQRKALKLNLKNPFTFLHESDSKSQ